MNDRGNNVTSAFPGGGRELDLTPLSVRSVMLSVLLGHHPAEAGARLLARFADHFAISEATLRVTVSRMVAAGDVERTERGLRLSPRLLARQRRQDAALDPELHEGWDGDWELAVVTGSGRPAAERAALRAELVVLRLAELREGVWLRPANLRRGWPAELDPVVTRLTVREPEDPHALVSRLWNLEGWQVEAQALAETLERTAEPRERVTVAAAIVRHLLRDPHLPAPLLPEGWSGPRLRELYAAYRAELAQLAEDLAPEPLG